MRPPFFYYRVKRAIPRPVQISLRRAFAVARRHFSGIQWPIDATAGARPHAFGGWPDGRKFALVLRHDVESQLGVSNALRLAALERARALRSAFYFVPEEYGDTRSVRSDLAREGFEIGVHGLTHDGLLYSSHQEFSRCAGLINGYLLEWEAMGFASPSSHHDFTWLHELGIEYDTSSFDTDPFEPQPDGVRTVFPLMQWDSARTHSYVELPYTLPQDFTLYVILQQTDISTWTRKLDWIAERGGMALINTHPDYMRFPGAARRPGTYDITLYEKFLDYVLERYGGEFWHALPRDIARYWRTATTDQHEPGALPAGAGRKW
jgi:peptidoglycan/xylan/chitin deacetylase (PgdA/CDA1 family)